MRKCVVGYLTYVNEKNKKKPQSNEKTSDPLIIVNGVSAPSSLAKPKAIAVLPVPFLPRIATRS